MKKLLATTLALLMMTTLLFGCGAKPQPSAGGGDSQTAGVPEENPFKVAIVLAVGGLGDGSYNDSVYEGFLRAEEELGVAYQLIEPTEIAELQSHFIQLAKSGEYDLIFGVSYECEEYVTAAAEQFPEQAFVIMDSTVADHSNITSVQISGPEMCFICGVIAGMYSETGVVGIMGGMESPLMDSRCLLPFTAGAKMVNPDIEVKVKVSGSWSDSSAGKEVALALNQEGCDVIMPYAGGSGLGVFTAAEEKGFYVVGAGSNQNGLLPAQTIASGTFFYGNMALRCIEEAMAGTLKSGLMQAGMAENGVGFTTEGSTFVMEQAEKDRLEAVKQGIIDGTIIVPESQEAFDEAVVSNGTV